MATYEDLENKTIVVTGAGSGIGRSLALRFADAKAKVAVNDISEEHASGTVQLIKDSGGTATAIPGDVSVSSQVHQMFQTVDEKYGPTNVLINNAGLVGPMLHFFEATEEWWRRIIDVNLTGHFLCCQAAAAVMAQNGGGSIINMSSGGASQAHRSFTAYDASKGGIEAFTHALALDLGPYSIRVNALMPGSIDTSGMNSEDRVYRGENIPLMRVGEAYDLTGPALFLASDESSYITGDVLKVDGGMLAQQRSATVDIMPPSDFPKLENI